MSFAQLAINGIPLMTIEKITLNYPESKSADITQENIDQLKQLFPEVFSEGKIDFDALKAVLGEVVDDSDERYNFTWHGKTRARQIAQTPSTGTLRPCKEESVNWDTTENLFIEGDNLEVLKLLQKAYHKKVKMIYIDPPYNTGKDFVYTDHFQDNIKNYLEVTGQVSIDGKKLSTNTEASGRYHSNWLSMMYPRLKLARNLLKEDGVIFVSIDDNESSNLRNIMNEIFGETNFVADVCVVNNLKGRNDKKNIATANERLLMYKKSDLFEEYGLDLTDSKVKDYKFSDENGRYRLIELRKRGGADTREERPNMYYPFYVDPMTGNVSLEQSEVFSKIVLPAKSNNVDGRWRWGKSTASLRLDSLIGRTVRDSDKRNIYEKDYLDQSGTIKRVKPKSVMFGTDYSTDGATKKYRALMTDVDFDNPKPVEFIEDLVVYSCPPNLNEICMDFFSGSGTLAHAIMARNSKDNGNRKFIAIQLPELLIKPISEYKKISDITKKRIRRAGDKIALENSNVDTGFKAFTLSDTNINSWDADFDDLESVIQQAANSIKDNRSSEDILYEILLKYGIELTTHVEEAIVEGKRVFVVGTGALMVCLDDGITEQVVEGIVKLKEKFNPESTQVVFKDQGFADSVVKANTIQILKQYGINDVKSI
ncbi:site-specific DNA-methyltransferase [Xenorhabdus khoisanae]|nr:site-specific DNA-methyltransferase [Xenorhabdus khoisanae]